MLAEVEHRTANDFALAMATLQIVRRDVPAERRAEIDGAVAKLAQQAALSRLLLPPLRNDEVDLEPMIRKLCGELSKMRLKPDGIALTVDVDRLELPARTCWMLSAVVAELVLNAAKHAFRKSAAQDGIHGSVAVSFEIEEAALLLRVTDDGVGQTRITAVNAGQGSAILAALVRSLGANLQRPPVASGMTVEIRMPMSR